MVIEPPSEIAAPLILMLLFVREPFAILDSVLLAPLIVLFVNVSLPAKVARVPAVGSVTLVVAVAVNVWLNAPA